MSGEEKARSTLLFSGSGKKLAWVGYDSCICGGCKCIKARD